MYRDLTEFILLIIKCELEPGSVVCQLNGDHQRVSCDAGRFWYLVRVLLKITDEYLRPCYMRFLPGVGEHHEKRKVTKTTLSDQNASDDVSLRKHVV